MIVFVFILARKLKMFYAIRASEDARSVSSSSKIRRGRGGVFLRVGSTVGAFLGSGAVDELINWFEE
jgi:hypothetical protein